MRHTWMPADSPRVGFRNPRNDPASRCGVTHGRACSFTRTGESRPALGLGRSARTQAMRSARTGRNVPTSLTKKRVGRIQGFVIQFVGSRTDSRMRRSHAGVVLKILFERLHRARHAHVVRANPRLRPWRLMRSCGPQNVHYGRCRRRLSRLYTSNLSQDFRPVLFSEGCSITPQRVSMHRFIHDRHEISYESRRLVGYYI